MACPERVCYSTGRRPPLSKGPLRGVTIDMEGLEEELFRTVGRTRPLEARPARRCTSSGSTQSFHNPRGLRPLFTAILLPLGLLAFGQGLKLARREGSLIHY
jgi:hypothetical protein